MKNTAKQQPAKRVDIVSIKLVKDSSIKYNERKLDSPYNVYSLLKNFLQYSDREKLMAVCVDTKNQPTNISTISIGTIDASLVHPREVFKTAILSNSTKIILAHNHPSGYTHPSEEDRKITKRIKEAGEILGIKLLDHIIIGDENYFSFKNEGIL